MMYVIVDLAIKNIGKTALEGQNLQKVDEIGGKDLSFPNNQLADRINQFEGGLQPGEKIKGQLAFALIPTDTYKLVFGMHLGSVLNEITWELDAE